jgi:CRP-like cAMP-binding protein
MTLWQFRPLVQENGAIGWTIMQMLARELRATEQALTSARSTAARPADPTADGGRGYRGGPTRTELRVRSSAARRVAPSRRVRRER